MENSKTYKLYKSGKLWVISAVAVADTVSSTAEKSTVPTTAGRDVITEYNQMGCEAQIM